MEKFGGNYAPEILLKKAYDLHAAFQELMIKNLKELEKLFNQNMLVDLIHFFKLKNLTKLNLAVQKIWIKHEAQCHLGSHKLNKRINSGLIAKYMGQKKILSETGAGMARYRIAMAASRLGLKSQLFLWEKYDMKKQHSNVMRMKTLGTKVVPVTSGSQTLVEAVFKQCGIGLQTVISDSNLCWICNRAPPVFVKLVQFGHQ